MKQSSLWHLPHYLPKLGALHSTLSQAKHHTGVNIGFAAFGEAILQVTRPDRTLFFISNLGDDPASLDGGPGKSLFECMVLLDEPRQNWDSLLLMTILTNRFVESFLARSMPNAQPDTVLGMHLHVEEDLLW